MLFDPFPEVVAHEDTMSIELRYSLLALLAAVISAAYWVLTEVTVNYFRGARPSSRPCGAACWAG